MSRIQLAAEIVLLSNDGATIPIALCADRELALSVGQAIMEIWMGREFEDSAMQMLNDERVNYLRRVLCRVEHGSVEP